MALFHLDLFADVKFANSEGFWSLADDSTFPSFFTVKPTWQVVFYLIKDSFWFHHAFSLQVLISQRNQSLKSRFSAEFSTLDFLVVGFCEKCPQVSQYLLGTFAAVSGNCFCSSGGALSRSKASR